MKEYLHGKRKETEKFLEEYGKVASVLALLVVSFISLCFLISLNAPSTLRVSFLDIGQGDAILIQTPSGHTMLVDGGPTNKILEKLSSKISYLTHDIDVMVATHPDADHVTGLIPVLEKYKVGTILISSIEGHTQVFDDLTKHIEDEHGDVHVAHSGDVIDFHDGVTANILYPASNYVPKKNDTNDASVSILVTYGDETFLLTGDLPSTEESKLISSGLPKNITVYKAGHHGSKTSSGEQLLTYMHPEYAVISAGKDNKYGHPNRETMERLTKYAKEILSTIDRGTISFVTDGRLLEVETEK